MAAPPELNGRRGPIRVTDFVVNPKSRSAALALLFLFLASCNSPVGPAGQARIVIELPPHTGGIPAQTRWAPLDEGTTVREATLAMWPEIFTVWDGDRAASYLRMIRFVEDNDPESGWHYSVNGAAPKAGPQQRLLRDGDTVVWRYL
jgi:hypothetical protein